MIKIGFCVDRGIFCVVFNVKIVLGNIIFLFFIEVYKFGNKFIVWWSLFCYFVRGLDMIIGFIFNVNIYF